MVDPWLVIGYLLIAFMGGAVTGAIALIIGGAGSLRVLAKRLNLLEERQDELEDGLGREVKKRASAKGVEARRTTKEAEAEANAVLAAAGNPIGLPANPYRSHRPTVHGR